MKHKKAHPKRTLMTGKLPVLPMVAFVAVLAIGGAYMLIRSQAAPDTSNQTTGTPPAAIIKPPVDPNTLKPGDTNADNRIDQKDIASIAKNIDTGNATLPEGQADSDEKTREEGDLNGDGKVDYLDLSLAASSYGQ